MKQIQNFRKIIGLNVGSNIIDTNTFVTDNGDEYSCILLSNEKVFIQINWRREIVTLFRFEGHSEIRSIPLTKYQNHYKTPSDFANWLYDGFNSTIIML